MGTTCKGPWSTQEIADFLIATQYPLRLACNGEDGYPRVVSLWFAYRDGDLFCASHASSPLISMLRSNGRVGFEVGPNKPPYFGVRGQGDVVLAEEGGADMLRQLLTRYLGDLESPLARWLLSRSSDEVLITIKPRRWFSWDYRQRMGSTDASPD